MTSRNGKLSGTLRELPKVTTRMKGLGVGTALLALRGGDAVGLGGVLEVAALERSQCQSPDHPRSSSRVAYKVPGAGTVGVGALVAGELVDEDTSVAVEVGRAVADGAAAGRGGRAVGLEDVLEGASLQRRSQGTVSD